MAKHVRTAVLLIVIVAVQSCYHVRTFIGSQPATQYQQKTSHTLFWGLVQDDVKPPLTDNCMGGGFQEVRVTTNFGYALLTVVTLGIWCPMEVEWRCTKEAPPTPPTTRSSTPQGHPSLTTGQVVHASR